MEFIMKDLLGLEQKKEIILIKNQIQKNKICH